MSPDNFASTQYGWLIALAAFAVLIFAVVGFGIVDPKRPIIEDLNGKDKYFSTDSSAGYSPGKLFEMLGTHYNASHFVAHRRFIKYDFAFAVLYAVTSALIIIYLQGALAPGDPARWRYLWLAPVLAGLFDILEGVSMLYVLDAYKGGTPKILPTAMAQFSSLMTTGKTLFIVATAALLSTGGAGLVLKKVWHVNL